MTIEAPDDFASARRWADSSKYAVGQSTLAPNDADMRTHLDHLFGGYLDGHHDGRVELSWTETSPDDAGRYRLRHACFFGTDQLDELVEEAARLNAQPMCNVYVGAALRHPDTPPFGRARDDDFGAAMALWCDLDSADAVQQALANYAHAKPTLLVMTGEHPHQRVQCWWRLAEAIEDPETLRNALSGIAYKMGGDTTVTNPSRVMRLAGSIAWPHKPGRVAELTRVVPLREPGLPEYYPDHLERVFPPVVSLAAARERRHGPDGGDGSIVRETSAIGLQTGKVTDGREKYMRNIVLAALIEHVGRNGAEPDADELFEAAWPIYRKHADLTRPGRGKTEFREKCGYALRRFAAGQLPGLETPERVVEVWQRKQAARAAYSRPVLEAPPVDAVTELEWFDDIEPVISTPYIVKDVLDLGAMSVVYGPSNSGKTFYALDIAYHVAIDHSWRSRRVAGGSVLYLAAEGGNGIANRIVGLKKTSGVVDVPFALRRAGLDLLHPDADTERVILLAEEVGRRAPLKLIVIDTLSRVMAGGDENGPVDMTAFIKNVDRIRQATGAHIMIVHHTGKDVTKGARGHSSLRAATDTEIEVATDDTDVRLAKVTKQRDLQGGDEFAFRLDAVALGVDDDGDTVTTCVVVPVEDRPRSDDALPSRAICKAILKAVDEAWQTKHPFSMAPQAKASGRYAPRALGQQFDLPGKVIEILLISWIDNAIIAVEETDSHTKKRGLKVLEWLD